MAFNVSSQHPKAMESIGQYSTVATAVGALTAGSKAFTFTQFSRIDGAVVASQTANAARPSDITGNVVTITGTGTDVVMVLAWGQLRA